MANAEEIRRVVKLIEAEPHRWNQGVWLDVPLAAESDELCRVNYDCGTRACVAGHTVMLAGLTVMQDECGNFYVGEGADPRLVEDVAAQILGLDEDEADIIFDAGTGRSYGSHDYEISELKRVITEVTGVTFDD